MTKGKKKYENLCEDISIELLAFCICFGAIRLPGMGSRKTVSLWQVGFIWFRFKLEWLMILTK